MLEKLPEIKEADFSCFLKSASLLAKALTIDKMHRSN